MNVNSNNSVKAILRVLRAQRVAAQMRAICWWVAGAIVLLGGGGLCFVTGWLTLALWVEGNVHSALIACMSFATTTYAVTDLCRLCFAVRADRVRVPDMR